MATIPRAALDYVSEQINMLSADARARVLRVLESIEWTPGNVAECRAAVVEALESVLPMYTSAAAQASADLYDAIRQASVGAPLGAQAYSGYDPAATAGAIRAFTQKVVDGKPVETFDNLVLSRVDYELRHAANYCITANGRRDALKPKYARVPTGAETCDFCLMLASRGFVYHSVSSAAVDQTHERCDCRVVPGFPGDEVEGYDTQEISVGSRTTFEIRLKEEATALDDVVLQTICGAGHVTVKDLRRMLGFARGRSRRTATDLVNEIPEEERVSLEPILTRLMMEVRVVIADFEYNIDRHGNRYGWGVARYTTPETLYGNLHTGRTPEESRQRIYEHLRGLFPEATEKQVGRLIG